VDLDDPATTVALLKVNPVVGVKGFLDPNGTVKAVGITCALCHSTVAPARPGPLTRRARGRPGRRAYNRVPPSTPMNTSLLIGLALADGAPGPAGPPREAPSVVGRWVGKRGLVGGDDRGVGPGGVVFEFTADGKMEIREGANAPQPARYAADPAKDPAEIDVTDSGGPRRRVTVGIYKVEKDTLTICLSRGGPRPTKFESPKGSDVTLLTLRRAE
jgi:uncharacterized protein (TIGR03067 family)